MLLFFFKIILEYGNFGGPGSYGGMPPQFNVPPPSMGGGYPGPAQGANFGGQQQPPSQGGYGGSGGGGASGGSQGN